MRLITIPALGDVELLSVDRLAGWNAIARDPLVHDQLRLLECDADDVASLEEKYLHFPEMVRTATPLHYPLVVVDDSGAVLAALELSCYMCTDNDADFGVSVDIAVAADRRGRDIAPTVLAALAAWVDSVVPGAHAHADVCTRNRASTRAVGRRGGSQSTWTCPATSTTTAT
jgi:hypothetical protein